VTKQKTIQSLIADIDSLLAKFGSRFPWSKPNDLDRDREILERVRRSLLSMQSDELSMSSPQESAVKPIVQAVAQEMESIRQQVTEPLQAELSALRQQRDSLTQEIQRLELQKQQLYQTVTAKGTAQDQPLPEFAQDLIHQSTERLTQQLAQILLNLEAQLVNGSSTSDSPRQATAGLMSPQERLEQLRQLQRESDRMLINLDLNQRTLFEALDRDLQGYQQSLSQGLDKMHRLSNQGELLFTTLVNRLAQLLGRETSTLIQSSPPWSETAELSQSMPNSPPSTSKQEGIFVGLDQGSPPEFNVTLSANALTSSPPTQAQLPSKSRDQQWIDELDIAKLGDNPLDALINWDIDPPVSANDSDLQDLDFLLGIDSTPESTPPSFSSSAISQADTQQPIDSEGIDQTEVENRHHEIDELYNTLFGTEVVSDSQPPSPANTIDVTPVPPSASSMTPTDKSEEPTTQAFSETVSVEVVDYLFDGFTDPADEPSSSDSWVESLNLDQGSWESLLFDTRPTDAPVELNVVATPEPTPYPHHPHPDFDESQAVEKITTLTDLLDEMGLDYSPAVAETQSIVATREEEWFSGNSGETESSVTSRDDHYIPASPDEDLLAGDESQQLSNQEIRLDQITLEQLSEDLHSFEAADPLNTVSQPSPSSDRTVSPPSFDLDSIESLPMSEELLAEDWEEFALHDLSQEDIAFSEWQQSTPTDLDSHDADPSDPLVSDSEETTPPSPEWDDVSDDWSEESIDLESEDVVKEYALEDSVTPDQHSVSQPQDTSLEDGEQNRD